MGAPRKGQRGSPDPLDFDKNFSHVITVAPWVEIQMQGLNLPAPLDIQWPKCSAPRLPLSARAPHSPWCPPTTDPFRRLWPSPGKKSCGRPWRRQRRLAETVQLEAEINTRWISMYRMLNVTVQCEYYDTIRLYHATFVQNWARCIACNISVYACYPRVVIMPSVAKVRRPSVPLKTKNVAMTPCGASTCSRPAQLRAMVTRTPKENPYWEIGSGIWRSAWPYAYLRPKITSSIFGKPVKTEGCKKEAKIGWVTIIYGGHRSYRLITEPTHERSGTLDLVVTPAADDTYRRRLVAVPPR